MIELTIYVDDYPRQFIKTLVMLDQVTHIMEASRGMSTIKFANGKSITVTEPISHVEKLVRDYAERAQAERIEAMVKKIMTEQLETIVREK
jgi:nitrogen regulatory protein PII-like uncharacterized protein